MERFQDLFVGFQTVPQAVALLQPIGMNPGSTRRQQARGRRRVERQAQAPFRFLEGLDVGCDRRHVAPVDASRQQAGSQRRKHAYESRADRYQAEGRERSQKNGERQQERAAEQKGCCGGNYL